MNEQHKRNYSLKNLLGDSEKLDRNKLRNFILENYATIPPEYRSTIWKLMLGFVFNLNKFLGLF
jgi:hypothetical protein